MAYTDTGRTTDRRMQSRRAYKEWSETKPSFETTEFWAMVAGLAAVVVIYLLAEDASARPQHGGSGALYVLLKRRR